MKTKKVILGVLAVIIILILVSANVLAATKTELENQNDDIQQRINQTKDDLSEIGANLSGTLKEIQDLNTQISSYENEIEELDEKISQLGVKVEEAEKQLKEAEEKYAKQEESLQNRLVALYEAGETTYLDMLLTSSGLTDFISNYYLVSEIATYDTELLDQMDKNKKEIDAVKQALEESKNQVEVAKNNKESTKTALKNSQDVKEEYAGKLTEEEKAKKEELEQFEADKRAIQAELAAIAAKDSGGKEVITGNPSSSGYIFPVAGLSKSNINVRTYPSYPGHTGADVNINVIGKNIVAVKSGTVVTSTALRNSNGSYRSYGEYIVINHHDGTMTLYAHGLSGSRRVSVGQEVSQGQVLMTVGSTGNSTGPHLHFEVRINGYPVNPLPYL